MGDIFKFIVDNFGRLTPIDFFFLGTLLLLSSLGIFFTLRWIFGALIKSQQQLISIKEEIILSYQKDLEHKREERAFLQLKLSELDTNLQFLSAEHSQTVQQKDVIYQAYSRLYLNALSMRVALYDILRAYLQLRIFESTRSILVMYAGLAIHDKYPEAPDPYTIDKQLDVISEKVHSPFSGIELLISDTPEQLLEELHIPTQLSQINYDEVNPQIDELTNQMRNYLDRYFKGSPPTS